MNRFNFSEIFNYEDVVLYLVKVLMIGFFTTVYWIVLSEIYVIIDGFISLPIIPIPYDSETDSVVVGLFSVWFFVFCLSYSILWDRVRGLRKDIKERDE